MKLLFRLLNPIVKFILDSPLHFILSKNLLALTFYGKKTGKKYKTPLSYLKKDDNIFCLTDRPNIWWRNLILQSEVEISLKGNRVRCLAIAELESESIEELLIEIIHHSPIDAFFAGIKFVDGKPDSRSVKEAVQRLVLLRLSL